MPNLHIIKLMFEENISSAELSYFRGALIKMSGNNELFHNHREKGFQYSYPKIQYKIIDEHAAIIGINEGAEALKQILLERKSFSCRLGAENLEFHIATVEEEKCDIILTESFHAYQINNWLPLNSRNYDEYIHSDGLIQQVTMLERILTGNILSLAKGLDIFFDSKIICRIHNLKYDGNKAYKGVGLMSFSASFRSNILLPQWIGLGKSASLNHGVITFNHQ